MTISERQVGDVVILDLTGKMTLGGGDEILTEKIKQLVHAGHRKVLLNGADQPYIDSAGLGAIYRAYTHVARNGGKLKLLRPTQRVMDLLSITRQQTIFEIYEHETEAVNSFAA